MVDITKLKGNMEGLVGSLKTMINPSGAVPTVNPDDALGLKIAEMAMLIKQLADVEQEQVRQLNKLSELMNGAFHDIEALRASVKVAAPANAKTDDA